MKEYLKAGNLLSFVTKLEETNPKKEQLSELLCEAVTQGLSEFVELLLKKGADPNQGFESNMWDPLHLAVENSHLTIVDMLVRGGADVNNIDGSGLTPLHLAVDSEADGAYQMGEEAIPNISRRLLELGANPLVKDSSGSTVVSLAQEYEYQTFLDLLPKSA